MRLQVARVTKIIDAVDGNKRYMINLKHHAKFVVELSDQVAPEDVHEGIRVAVNPLNYKVGPTFSCSTLGC